MKPKLSLIAVISLLAFALPGLAAQWTSITPLPDAYDGQSLVYASGYLYQAGGQSTSDGLLDGSNVIYAQVYSDGTIGSWSPTTSLPEAVDYHAGVAASGYVYVLGGQHYNPVDGIPSVYSLDIRCLRYCGSVLP